MNRLVRGSVMLAAAAFVWACGGDPTAGDAKNIVKLQADPAVVFVSNASDSQAVIVEAVNNLDQQDGATFSITASGAGIIVTRDTAYGKFTNGDQVSTRARYFVKAASTTSFVSTTFTISGGGKTLDIPVRVTPAFLDVGFSNSTPALGEAVTITAPTNVVFTASTTVDVGGNTGVVTGVSPDGSQLTFLLGPNITDEVASLGDVEVSYLPGQMFDLETTGTITTPVVSSIPAAFASATPNVGDTVTMTLTAPFKALPNVSISFGGVASVITGISADSSSVQFLPPPASTGSPTLDNVIISGVPVPINLVSSGSLTVANATNYTGTDALATAPSVAPPASGETTGFFDLGSWGGNCGGAPCQWYRLDVTTAGDYHFSSVWDNNSDLGIYVVNSTGTSTIGACDAAGNGSGAQPEACDITLAVGTYYIQMQNFAPFYPDPDPAWFGITIMLP
ncbi:MAG: hypothetical protein AB7I33_14605 [Gemmatimonadales bacterium]